MIFDAWIVGYGLAAVLGALFGIISWGYAIWAGVIGIDMALLYKFFRKARAARMGQEVKKEFDDVSMPLIPPQTMAAEESK